MSWIDFFTEMDGYARLAFYDAFLAAVIWCGWFVGKGLDPGTVPANLLQVALYFALLCNFAGVIVAGLGLKRGKCRKELYMLGIMLNAPALYALATIFR